MKCDIQRPFFTILITAYLFRANTTLAWIKQLNSTTKQIKTLMNTTQKTLNALIYTLCVLLAGSLGALLMFLVIDV